MRRGARWCAALRRFVKQCRSRYGPNVLRCSARGATACNSHNYHIVNARSHNACGAFTHSTQEAVVARCSRKALDCQSADGESGNIHVGVLHAARLAVLSACEAWLFHLLRQPCGQAAHHTRAESHLFPVPWCCYEQWRPQRVNALLPFDALGTQGTLPSVYTC